MKNESLKKILSVAGIVKLLLVLVLLPQVASATGGHWYKHKHHHGGMTKTCDNSLTVPLLVDNMKKVGTVTVRYCGDHLKVKYNADNGWYISKTHLDVADSYNGLHVDNQGAPDTAAFEHSTKHFTPVKRVKYQLNASQWAEGTELYIAAHAEVTKKSRNGDSHHGKKKVCKKKNARGYSFVQKMFSKFRGDDDEDKHDDERDDDKHRHGGKKIVKSAWGKGEQFPAGVGSYFTYVLESCDEKELPVIQFAAPVYFFNETDLQAVISVVRSGDVSVESSVDFATVDGTAIAGLDYVAGNGTLTFAAGETEQSFIVDIIDDTEVEEIEHVGLHLSNAVNAELGQQQAAQLDIIDREPTMNPGVLQFKDAVVNVTEGFVLVDITVVRTEGSDGEVSVDYTTQDGTATAGFDYLPESGTLVFPDGVTEMVFQVQILEDRLPESSEHIQLELSNAVGAVLGGLNSAKINIHDNDGGPN